MRKILLFALMQKIKQMKTILFPALLIILMGVGHYYIIHTIEKHSVHPVYGNYKKVDSELKKCSPWEACS